MGSVHDAPLGTTNATEWARPSSRSAIKPVGISSTPRSSARRWSRWRLRVGRHERHGDAVAREGVEAEHELERRDAAAGDHDVERPVAA